MKNSKQQTTNNKRSYTIFLHIIKLHSLPNQLSLHPTVCIRMNCTKRPFAYAGCPGRVLCSPTTAVHVTERKRADGAFMRRHTSQEYITDPVPYSSVQNPPDRDHGFISRISDLDTGTLRTGMHDTSVSDIKRHMPCIADHISGLCIRIGNFCSRALQCPGSSRDRNAK